MPTASHIIFLGPNLVNFHPILVFKTSIWGLLGVLNSFSGSKIIFYLSKLHQSHANINVTAIFTVTKTTSKSQNGQVATTCDGFGYCQNLFYVFRCCLVIVACLAYAGVFSSLHLKISRHNSIFCGIGPIFGDSLIRPWDKMGGTNECTF